MSSERSSLLSEHKMSIQEAKQFQRMNQFIACCNLPVFAAGVSILLSDGGDCDTPVRLWVQVVTAVAMFPLLSWILIEIYESVHEVRSTDRILCILNTLHMLFVFTWFIVGNVWYFGITDCDDFKMGYLMLAVILGAVYIGIVALLLIMVIQSIRYCIQRMADTRRRNPKEADDDATSLYSDSSSDHKYSNY